MRVELELEENPGFRFTLTSGDASWKFSEREIKAHVSNDIGCGTYISIDGHRYRLDPKILVAAVAEKLGLAPND